MFPQSQQRCFRNPVEIVETFAFTFRQERELGTVFQTAEFHTAVPDGSGVGMDETIFLIDDVARNRIAVINRPAALFQQTGIFFRWAHIHARSRSRQGQIEVNGKLLEPTVLFIPHVNSENSIPAASDLKRI